LATFLLVLVLWRVVVLTVSATTTGVPPSQSRSDVEAARAAAGGNIEAVFNLAGSLVQTAPDLAASMLREALWHNPTAGRSVFLLSQIWAAQPEQGGDPARIDRAVDLATRLAPASPWILRGAGDYWARKPELDKTLAFWNRAMVADPRTRKEIYPVLLELAELPDAYQGFAPYASNTPPWWEEFFATVAKRARLTDTVAALYELRRQAPGGPTEEERKVYIARLLRDGNVAEAYIEWVNGLGRDQLRVLGLVYNGGFEQPHTNIGFDWHISPPAKVRIQAERMAGAEGEKALHIMFRGWEQRFAHVRQPLYLDPGRYRLQGSVSIDTLRTLGGFRWRLRCIDPAFSSARPLLGETERFLGTSEWRNFAVDFDVPDGCAAQQLVLESAGRDALEWETNGDIWFDSIAIRRQGVG